MTYPARPALMVSAPAVVASLPQVPYSPGLRPFLAEPDASAHWLFNTDDATCLADLISGQALTLKGTAPDYNPTSLVTADGGVHGLLTPFDDAATMTICGVFKKKSLASYTGRLLFGAAGNSSGDGGSLAYHVAAGSGGVNMRTRPGSNVSVAGSSAIADGAWFFAAMVNAPSDNDYYAKPSYTGGDTQAKTVAARKVGIGNAWYADANYYQGVEIAEVFVFAGQALDAAAIEARYLSAKTRQALLGNTVV